jgi:hypothetical protein
MSILMQAVFFGHGNPMNALLRNSYTERWAAIGADLPRPKAILRISAHWWGVASGATNHADRSALTLVRAGVNTATYCARARARNRNRWMRSKEPITSTSALSTRGYVAEFMNQST